MATYKLVINGVLPNLNAYIKALDGHRNQGAQLKKYTDEGVMWQLAPQLRGVIFKPPVKMAYLWVERDRTRDLDNIAFAKKFIQDAIVKLGALQNDGWQYICGFTDDFAVDKKRPRIEITITEVEKLYAKNEDKKGIKKTAQKRTV